MANLISSLYTRSVNDIIYDYALSSSYSSTYVYDPDFALAKDADIWEVVRRDPVIFSSMDRCNKSVVRPYHVEPPMGSKEKNDKQLASIVEDAIQQISMFDAARRHLANSKFLGRSYGYIEGEVVEVKLGGLPKMDWWVPKKIRNIDRRRFHWEAEWSKDGKSKTTHLSMFNTNSRMWERVTPEFRSALIEYTYHDTEDRLGYGRGMLEAIYFYHYMKTMAFQKVFQGIDRWANGVIIGKLDSLRNASTSKTNADLMLGMKNLLREARSEHVVVMQDGDEIEVVETSGTGHEITMNFIKHLEEGIERLVNGSILPGGHSEGVGSKARASVEQNTSEAFYQADRQDLDEVISRDLIRCFVRCNIKNLVKLGIADAALPHLDSEQTKREDPIEAVQVAAQALQSGVPLVKQEYYHKIWWTMPEEGDEVIDAPTEITEGVGGSDELSTGRYEERKHVRGAGGAFQPKPKLKNGGDDGGEEGTTERKT